MLQPSAISPLQSLGDALDGLDVALCAFDADDRALAWNNTFLRFFPEHEGHVHVGEPYAANLRRFYTHRLDAQEIRHIDRYIAAGIERHRQQFRPYQFEHRGLHLHASSQPLAEGGRVRVWRAEQMDAAVRFLPVAGCDASASKAGLAGHELFDRIPDGLMVCASDHTIQWVNASFVQMYGLSRSVSVTGLTFDEIYHRAWAAGGLDNDDQHRAGAVILRENMRFAGAPFEVPLPRGRWCRVIAKDAADGTVFYAHVDITELKRQQYLLAQAERSARESEARLREKSIVLEATLEHMDQGIAKISHDGVVELYNRRALELLDLSPELMAARPTLEQVLAYLRDRGEFVPSPPEVQAMLQKDGGLDRLHVYDRVRPDGTVLEVQTIPIAGGGALRTITDVTARRAAEQRIRHVADHDALTSLLNRAAFLQALRAAVADLRRHSRGMAVLYMDLDGFKPVNDRFGHAVGDQVLAEVASRLRQVAREEDRVARLGGDEFALLQRGVADEQGALRLAERLVEAVSQPIAVDAHQLRVGISIGIVMVPPAEGAEPMDTLLLLRQADTAMYAAKAAGRNRAKVFGG
ncbi:diguanylate cyclase domain-containing protein [Acidovorax sp. BL-A-41-H1]|uniref:diguanylate cyclase domain-containing protein n=1 Tax=Acidovorax sp. BL-A-41-H1 TaxID=3421102 RepID=UPI003F7B0DBC